MNSKFKFFRQLDFMDCGPTSLKMVAAFHGKDYSIDFLRASTYIQRSGVSLNGISEAAEKIGFKTLKVKLTVEQLISQAPLPAILHWNQDHFVVIYQIKRSFWAFLPWVKDKDEKLVIADPGHDLVVVDKTTFLKCWVSDGNNKGIALLLEPTPEFYQKQDTTPQAKTGFSFLFSYLTPYKKYLTQIFIGMIFGSILSMIFPFLTQSLVDFGIHRHNMGFIHLILLSQLLLFIGGVAVDMIRNWILLHISTRVSVTIISNFLVKLMQLPISFFETKNVGDITQRIQDHHRIETFLTGTTLNTFFSIINLIVFSVILGIYSTTLLSIFFVGSALSVLWIMIFLKQRKNLDYNRFQQMRENQDSIFELITGMQEIKLNNCEKARRWDWERIQAKLFKINIKGLALEQYQEAGVTFFTQLKNIMISYVAATQVIDNKISLGVMLSISYIIGQMNGPLSQLMVFVRSIQDAKISLERLGEIHNKPNEELEEEHSFEKLNDILHTNSLLSDNYIHKNDPTLSLFNNRNTKGICLQNTSFSYGGPSSPMTLNQLNLLIPEGKVTAIVGTSGSGKTTLLKLLLKFYSLTEGHIFINGSDLTDMSAKKWRNECGVVLQDGYIFSDTIARNIAIDGQKIDEDRLIEAIRVANLQEYLRRLPLGLATKIGSSGSGLSGGQRQRIFIARAVYKNPKYIFFDEATSALDANNERVIMENLHDFFQNRTVVVIAHRLSTVKNADQIIVLENGEIKEVGNHQNLTSKRGVYFDLVKNQLELVA
ncbi:peptidase domain-containing ABC transporter [Arcicella sp. LKC2W]|uniref:peptidase domain-containing ABC transporter n=1 Tax=Arcicella sp. LKC2W TaxID=2984198 RepID=UPI002B1F4004|nr:peptidase domain-containing ABC transporter [Arcicella sp. LKC2W]MEA5460948.1 peptidase domain-containing ABC transporter [Arcicella sp. LKC2W]